MQFGNLRRPAVCVLALCKCLSSRLFSRNVCVGEERLPFRVEPDPRLGDRASRPLTRIEDVNEIIVAPSFRKVNGEPEVVVRSGDIASSSPIGRFLLCGVALRVVRDNQHGELSRQRITQRKDSAQAVARVLVLSGLDELITRIENDELNSLGFQIAAQCVVDFALMANLANVLHLAATLRRILARHAPLRIVSANCGRIGAKVGDEKISAQLLRADSESALLRPHSFLKVPVEQFKVEVCNLVRSRNLELVKERNSGGNALGQLQNEIGLEGL